MKKFGPPPGCTCESYFELNGQQIHDDDCPCFDHECMDDKDTLFKITGDLAEEERRRQEKELEDLM